MARDAAHVPRGGIMDHAAPWFAVHHFSGRNTRKLHLSGQISGVHHFQRLINLTLDELLQRSAAYALDDFAKQKEIDVAVAENRAGDVLQPFFASFVNCRLPAMPVTCGFDVRTETGDVSQ